MEFWSLEDYTTVDERPKRARTIRDEENFMWCDVFLFLNFNY
jgi:hypothetical protein